MKEYKNLKISRDIWFCAFLINKGHEVVNYQVIERGKISCQFDIADDSWKQLKLEFHNSEISEYKAIIDKLKDLAY